jgi:hypothetical protein
MQELLKEYVYNHERERGSRIELLTGEDALSTISQPSFFENWRALNFSCPWSTVFQGPEFITNWYSAFSDNYFPVVVYRMAYGELVGLLCMAIPSKNKSKYELANQKNRIVGAGEYDAEYQCWIAKVGKGQEFILDALSLIRAEFPKSHVLFRFIPSNAPLDWVKNSAWKKMSILQSHERPLLNYSHPEAKEAYKISKQYKTKLNRLKREGNVVFERIYDELEFASVLDEIALQFDFRQGGLFNKSQFRDNPKRKEFMLGLFRDKVLHVTVLRVDGQIIGSMGALYGKNWVHLQGFNTHSPFVARHSPGILHFLHLSKFLDEEGVEVFDLTPGGDQYKEKMATSYDEVFTLALAADPFLKFKKDFKKSVHAFWLGIGKRPMTEELKLERKSHILKHKFSLLQKGEFKELFGGEEFIDVEKIPASLTQIEVRKNALEDLLDCDLEHYRRTRWEYLDDSLTRLEKGETAYTWASHGKLLAAVWVVNSEDKFSKGFPEGITLHNPYCHPEAPQGFYHFLKTCLEKVRQEFPQAPIQVLTQNGYHKIS